MSDVNTSREVVEAWIKANATLVPGDYAQGLLLRVRALLAERDALLDAAEAVLRTVGMAGGRSNDDHDTHNGATMDALRKQVAAIRALPIPERKP